jgi:response regulator RpfG family c-di-GMP phosphodiesterase
LPKKGAAQPAPQPPPSAPANVITLPPPSLAVMTPGFAFAAAGAPPAGPSFLELLNVLVSLLEHARTDLRGHSSQVARLARRLAEKLSLEPTTTGYVVFAAYVHDLGKMGQYHLTALNCSEYEGHKAAAQKVYGVPARLLEPVRVPGDVARAVEHMYERWDGKGFPDGQSGKDIPLGARILAICDTYADLTQNPRNPYRKALAPNEACAALSQHRGTIFDPNLVDLFHHTVLGEDLKARLLASRSQALLVDTDPEETTVLELRMIEQGFVVKTARSAEQALNVLAEGETDLVVSEIDLGTSDGLGLLATARRSAWGKELPWVVYTRRQERAVAQKAFEMGVLDFVNKPANADVLVAKLKAMLDQRASARTSRGVSGSLREMGLPDMVQVLFHGRKSGSLRIRARDGAGEIHFLDGNVVNAVWGELKGVDAFYAMLKLADGEFALDPAFKPATRVIHESSEALLLEGMRRLDEGIGP